MSKTLSALVGVSMLGLVGAANAAEPTTLADEQMDRVVAGVLDIQVANIAANVLAAFRNNAQNINNSLVNQQ